MESIALSNLINADVYTPGGRHAANVVEFIVDPNVGVVRFIRLSINAKRDILLPWAAVTYAKSGSGFILTHMGEKVLESRLEEATATRSR